LSVGVSKIYSFCFCFTEHVLLREGNKYARLLIDTIKRPQTLTKIEQGPCRSTKESISYHINHSTLFITLK